MNIEKSEARALLRVATNDERRGRTLTFVAWNWKRGFPFPTYCFAYRGPSVTCHLVCRHVYYDASQSGVAPSAHEGSLAE